MNVSITLDELMSELVRLGVTPGQGNGKSVKEWQDEWRVSKNEAVRVIRRCQAAGLVTVSREGRPAMDGTMRPVPVYAIRVEPEKPVRRGKVRAS